METELNEFQRVALDMAITKILTQMGIDLVGTQWMKALGDGLYEFRIRHSSSEIQSIYTSSESRPRSSHQEILLRVFISFHGKKLVLLLHGYDNGKNDSKKKQQEEIEIARRRLRAWKRTYLG